MPKTTRPPELLLSKLRVGAPVVVTRDDGTQWQTTVKYEPWQLGGGQWVVGVVGKSGGILLERVAPAEEE